MIYMVDHVFEDPATEPDWHAWYADYLRKLTAVPGIRSAQRFKALGCTPSRYLAMYTVDSAEVFTSEPYKAMGGGGSRSARFHPAYRLWTRNLFVAAAGDDAQEVAAVRAPAVRDGERVLVFDRNDRPPRRFAPPLLVRRGEPNETGARDAPANLEDGATWLESVGLHMTTRYRAFVVLQPDAATDGSRIPASFLYEPFTPFIS